MLLICVLFVFECCVVCIVCCMCVVSRVLCVLCVLYFVLCVLCVVCRNCVCIACCVCCVWCVWCALLTPMESEITYIEDKKHKLKFVFQSDWRDWDTDRWICQCVCMCVLCVCVCVRVCILRMGYQHRYTHHRNSLTPMDTLREPVTLIGQCTLLSLAKCLYGF